MVNWFISNRLGIAIKKNWLTKNDKNYFPIYRTEDIMENIEDEDKISSNKKVIPLDDPNIDALMSQGFSKKYSYYALQESNGDLVGI
jgi:Zn-finger domain-containing protein